WGQGIGTRMLAEAIRFFERQGVEHIILDTQADNERSQRLYRWFGFTPTGRARDVLVLEIMSARNVSVRALITDFGGVLTRTEKLRALMEHYERELGLEKGTLQTTLFAGEAWEAFSTGRISYEDYWANVCARLGWPIPPEFESLRDNPFALDDLDERMVALLRQLRSNYKIALLSNATPALEGLLERYGIANLFDVVINSSRVGLRKPDLRIYALTAERLGLRPEECLLIDDKERNTSAAREIGMHAITFTSYEDLTRHLEKMLGRSVTA
ncbi:MAG: HAD-IA family hydrolase, partial [Chloroflexi bacterium]|nr:HAD-IA family hydrolase [Chloroflexota bacterium]